MAWLSNGPCPLFGLVLGLAILALLLEAGTVTYLVLAAGAPWWRRYVRRLVQVVRLELVAENVIDPKMK